MKNTLFYKDFTARVEFDADDNIFVGRVLGVRSIIGFHGKTVSELTKDFHNAIDHYLKLLCPLNLDQLTTRVNRRPHFSC